MENIPLDAAGMPMGGEERRRHRFMPAKVKKDSVFSQMSNVLSEKSQPVHCARLMPLPALKRILRLD